MGVTALIEQKKEFGPLLPAIFSITAPDPDRCPPDASYVDFSINCARELEKLAIEGNIAAFIAEPILGAAGVIIPPKEYFQTIKEICVKYDVLLILDEVATGFGRTGKWFATEHYGIEPDILLLAKGINSGYLPLGAVLFSEQIGNTMLEEKCGLGHGSSHNGNPPCCAAALATIDVIRNENLIEKSVESGTYFRSRLEELRVYPWIKEIRSIGLMLSVVFAQEDGRNVTQEQVDLLCKALKNKGVLAYPGGASLVFCPALIISQQEIDEVVDALQAVLKSVRLHDGEMEFVAKAEA
jgi:putrescine aminotransferase